LQYSYVKRGLLAAGGEDGSLRLWDTSVSTTAIQTYEKAHLSEIKGIAFSPSNQHLLITAGMDKRIVLYDVGKKEYVVN
jgi:WD40 repeat protein